MIKKDCLTKLAELAQQLDNMGAADEAVRVDGLVAALAENKQIGFSLKALSEGISLAAIENMEARNQMNQLEGNEPKQQAPQRPKRSVLKVTSKGMTLYPTTVKQLRNAIKQYGLIILDVIRSILVNIDASAEEYASTVTLDDAIKLAVKHGLLKDSWF